MQTIKIFLASSSELKADREQFEIFINRKNNDWVEKGIFLRLIVWENFLDAMSRTRLQDEYNKAIAECDIFIMLFFSKVGKYTEEEFEKAFGQFKQTGKPLIFTYFKDAQINTGGAKKNDLMSLWAFQEKLDSLGHFYTVYKNIEDLKFQFSNQLDKLAGTGFIQLKPTAAAATPDPSGDGGSSPQSTPAHSPPKVMVVGLGADHLPQAVNWMSRSIGKTLAQKKMHLVVGGWKGVDYVTADAFATQINAMNLSLTEYLTVIVPRNTEPIFRGGNISYPTVWNIAHFKVYF